MYIKTSAFPFLLAPSHLIQRILLYTPLIQLSDKVG